MTFSRRGRPRLFYDFLNGLIFQGQRVEGYLQRLPLREDCYWAKSINHPLF